MHHARCFGLDAHHALGLCNSQFLFLFFSPGDADFYLVYELDIKIGVEQR